MSPQYVQKIEQGKIKSLGLDTADKLKKVLACKAGDLLEDIADTDFLPEV
jgi:DNA-binding Xre family transcriptional regulator